MASSFESQLQAQMNKKAEAQARKILKREGDKLENITKATVNSYYNSYRPSVYVRTYGFKNSVVKTGIKRVGNSLEMSVGFDGGALHNSMFAGNAQGYVPILLSNGWHSVKLERRVGPIHRFTFYGGFNIIGKIQSSYNAVRHPLVKPLEIKSKWSV